MWGKLARDFIKVDTPGSSDVRTLFGSTTLLAWEPLIMTTPSRQELNLSQSISRS
jgi:hypothetical protein